jgi:hypothetical protein
MNFRSQISHHQPIWVSVTPKLPSDRAKMARATKDIDLTYLERIKTQLAPLHRASTLPNLVSKTIKKRRQSRDFAEILNPTCAPTSRFNTAELG